MYAVALSWKNAHLHGNLWAQSHQLRYRAFIERQHWSIPNDGDMEWDQYDNPRATYVVVDDGDGRCIATCRLLSTTCPYMIEEIFPHMLPYPPPKQHDIWEASRVTVDSSLSSENRRHALRILLLKAQQLGIDRGVKHYLGLMPVAIFRRTIIKNGVNVNILLERAAPVDGILTATGEMLVDEATLHRLRSHPVQWQAAD